MASLLFDSGIFSLGEGRQTVRLWLNYVVDGLGIAAAVCAASTAAAVSIINLTLATGPNLDATAPIGPEMVVLADHHPTYAGTVSSSDSARVSTDSADTVTFGARWSRASAPTSITAVPLASQHPLELASDVASLQPNPLNSPQSQAKPKAADAPDLKDVAQLAVVAPLESARSITLTHPAKLIP
jgi:hypothetical protein